MAKNMMPKEVAAYLRDAKSAIHSLDDVVSTLFENCDGGTMADNIKYVKAMSEAHAAQRKAEARLEELENEAEEKRHRIKDLQRNLEKFAEVVKDKTRENEELKQKIQWLQQQNTAAAVERDPVYRPRSASHVRSPSEPPPLARRPSRPRSPHFSPPRHRRADIDRDRGGSRPRKMSRSRSAMRSRSDATNNGGQGGDENSWNERRSGRMPTDDRSICIPFLNSACTKGLDCPLYHPLGEAANEARAKLRRKPCKHGAECARHDCIFQHPPNRTLKRESCRNFHDCRQPGCGFLHAWDRSRE